MSTYTIPGIKDLTFKAARFSSLERAKRALSGYHGKADLEIVEMHGSLFLVVEMDVAVRLVGFGYRWHDSSRMAVAAA